MKSPKELIIYFIFTLLIVFSGCSKDKSEKIEFSVLIRMLPNQEKFFRYEILDKFEKIHNCKIKIIQFDKIWDEETVLKLQKEKRNPNIALAKVPFEMTRVLAGKGYMEPLDNIINPDILERDLAEYHHLALGLGYYKNKPFYVPRKLETRVMFYVKSKVMDAQKNWEKFKKQINRVLKDQNGYGLPKGYMLEKNPKEWDTYDLFVMGYYWSHVKYFNTSVYMPRIAHRGDRYEGTALGLIDRSIQFGAKSEDILRMNTDPIIEMFNWEAVFIKNNIFNPGMWEDPWRGTNIYEAIKDGKVFLTFLQQIDCFLVHGWENNPEMQGYLKDMDDFAITTMPKAVSFELNDDGTYKKVGSKKISTGGWWWGIPKTSPYKELAYKLARFITNRENQALECSKFGMFPVRKDIINNLSDAFDLGWVGDIFKVSVDQIELNGLTTVPLIKEYSEIGKNYIEAWYEICIDEYYKSNKNKNVSMDNIGNRISNKFVPIQKEILKDNYPKN